jgi:opacity protein-like surface antigen
VKRFILYVVAVVCIVGATDTRAGANLGVRGIGARLSFVNPSDVDATMGFDFIADLGTLRQQLAVETTLDFWSSEEERNSNVDVRDVVLGARLKYTFDLANRNVRPYAAGGLALHFLHYQAPDILVGGVVFQGAEDDDTQLGVDLGGGVGFKTGDNIFVVSELMFRLVTDVPQVARTPEEGVS